MTIECQTLAVKIKANITATSMTLDQLECIEPCNNNVTITWQNTGGVNGSFRPAIVINGTKTQSDTQITLTPTETYTEIFLLTDLVNGTYSICPDPN